jgi:sugar O-acyltransferase (sialic acid O-acetyltransferase NeuD family)
MVTNPFRQPVVIVGSGSQAQTVIDILTRNNARQIEGIADIELDENIGQTRNGVEIRWTVKQLIDDPIDVAIVIAYGDQRKKKELATALKNAGYSFASAISETAYIAETAKIGAGTIICPSATILSNAIVRDHAIVRSQSVIEHDNNIGDYSSIAPGVSLAGRVTIGEGANIYTGASIIPNVSIGAWAIVGAGAVVLNDVEQGKTVVGNPATIMSPRTS